MDSKFILDGCVEIKTRSRKKDVTEIYPSFVLCKSSELMIRGRDFYAVWVAERGLWSTDEYDLITIIDREVSKYAEEYRQQAPPYEHVIVLYMRYAETGLIDKWHKYVNGQTRDRFEILDQKLIFANEKPEKKDYASKSLPYPLVEGSTAAYDRMMEVLYSPEERHKIEWAIGAIVSGDSRKIQKFVVLYGAPGTGKGTVLDIIKKMFEGYCCNTFDAKALGTVSNVFALEPFRNHPLVAIQPDGDLSRIEDNTRLNTLVSHESSLVNVKYQSAYPAEFKAFLFMGTNKPVKITDAKSGLIRRLIDVSPTGEKIPNREYNKLKDQVQFELGPIAWRCLKIYQEDPHYYDNYIPTAMMGASNDFYNFILDNYMVFKENDSITLTAAWKLYTQYCEDARVSYPMSKRNFKEELKNYFEEFKDRGSGDDGDRVRSFYQGFKSDIFESQITAEKPKEASKYGFLDFKEQPSPFDILAADWPAQYATKDDVAKPEQKWSNNKTKLRDLDTHQLHYVKVPKNHIVIDFDIPDENGEKSLELNLAEASKWPATYAELSKSGKGIHLHYIYDGDPSKLNALYKPNVEIKVSKGNSSLRRLLTKCVALEVAHIASGLPLKEEKPPMTNIKSIRTERSLRKQIERNLNREIHANTKPSMDMIKKLLDDAYDSGMLYDVSDMRNAIIQFAMGSTHQSDTCMKMIRTMHFKSEQKPEPELDTEQRPLVIFDCEVSPNLLLICWKVLNDPVIHDMVNPIPQQVEEFIENFDLVGFNNRKYDNHIIYARSIGMSNEAIFRLSKSMIQDKQGFLPQAYDISYTDIYDFSSKKQSLKKFEIELGIDHVELGLPWDEPWPEEVWPKVIEYCHYDVLATEAVFLSKDRQADFAGRKILAKIAGGTVNDTTNSLSAKFIFRGDKNPQSQFNYRFMGDIPEKVYRSKIDAENGVIFNNFGDEYTLFDEEGRPVFPGYTYDPINKVSTYRGEETGEGGYVYAEPGMYTNVALLDIESMHPHSAIAEKLFGEYYTGRFKEIVDARLAIKHKDIEKARNLLNGELAEYLDDPALLDGLKQALKIVINSVYGLTSAGFMNPFKDERNVDNIVAKRGALFMINLKHEVQRRGFVVAHIKTDSIKIPNATPEIIQFCMDYAEQYGYRFLHEATYERMCLVNNAVYIARYDTPEAAKAKYGYIPVDLVKKGGKWDATGTQFAVPYVFKSLFSHEPIDIRDMSETKSVSSQMYLDMDEGMPEGVHNLKFVGKVGRFCPILPGHGGGRLVREAVNKKTGEIKYDSVVGTRDYRWLEAEYAAKDDIDIRYYDELVNAAVDAITKYGDAEWFIHGEPEEPYPLIDPDEIPFPGPYTK